MEEKVPTNQESICMTRKEELIESITRLLTGLNEARLKNIYQFVLHISK